jgi:hypothetical protein
MVFSLTCGAAILHGKLRFFYDMLHHDDDDDDDEEEVGLVILRGWSHIVTADI